MARAAAYVARQLASHGGTELQLEVSRLVVYAFGYDTIRVATSTLRTRAGSWGIEGRFGSAPSYGTIYGVTDWMARHGYIAWAKAHVPRWHGKRAFKDRPRLYPRWTARCSEPRLPARKFHAIGKLAAILHGRSGGSTDRTLGTAPRGGMFQAQASSISPAWGADGPASPAGSPPGGGGPGEDRGSVGAAIRSLRSSRPDLFE